MDGQPAGRLYIAREGDEIRIVDIALLRECCNRGIGTTLLRGLQSEAAAAGKPLRIHVERFNPALRFYERLGFPQIDDQGVYLFLEWTGGVNSDNSQLLRLRPARELRALRRDLAGASRGDFRREAEAGNFQLPGVVVRTIWVRGARTSWLVRLSPHCSNGSLGVGR